MGGSGGLWVGKRSGEAEVPSTRAPAAAPCTCRGIIALLGQGQSALGLVCALPHFCILPLLRRSHKGSAFFTKNIEAAFTFIFRIRGRLRCHEPIILPCSLDVSGLTASGSLIPLPPQNRNLFFCGPLPRRIRVLIKCRCNGANDGGGRRGGKHTPRHNSLNFVCKPAFCRIGKTGESKPLSHTV